MTVHLLPDCLARKFEPLFSSKSIARSPWSSHSSFDASSSHGTLNVDVQFHSCKNLASSFQSEVILYYYQVPLGRADLSKEERI